MEENVTVYYISVGNFTYGDTTYTDRCLSASFGGSGVQSESIPWEGTNNNPWDYKYSAGAFVLDPIEMPVVPTPPTDLEQLRADVDYLLMMEG